MSNFSGLSIGASGLSAAQRALETAAHNVANANTEGYSRQRVETSTLAPLLGHRGLLGPGASGQGVGVDGISRASDALVNANYRDTLSQQAGWESRASFYARAEEILGPVNDGAAQALADFWNSWESLSQNPESATSREQVLDAGRSITGMINQAHRRVTNLSNDVAFDLKATAAEANDIADAVARLNAQIKSARAHGDTPNDLLDARDLALAQLASLTGAQTSIESDGDARVVVGGIPLVDGARSDGFEVTGAPPTLVWASDGTTAAAAGELGSLAELGDSATASILSELDEIAIELRDIVNAGHQSGYGLDGVDGRDFFSGTGAMDLGLAAGLTTGMVAASAGGSPADGNHALVMGALRTTPGTGGETVAELINSLQGRLGLEATHAQTQSEQSQVVAADARRMLGEVGGVSTDEELTDMLRFQRAYEASARVITVIDQMLDKLINGTGSTR